LVTGTRARRVAAGQAAHGTHRKRLAARTAVLRQWTVGEDEL
jgi:hypothetical protein